jgi:hypothetical protein
MARTGGVVDEDLPGPAARLAHRVPRRQEARSMIRQTGVSSPESDAEDRSMRFVEYPLALVAVLAAGILAFIR